MSLTGGPHAIATPAHCLDHVAADLVAQVVDVNLDGVALDLFLPSVKARLQIVFRVHHLGTFHQFVQRLGDWSYSIYLWHWPIWVFAFTWLSLRGDDVNATEKILLVATSLVLSAASYYLVEQPVRKRRDLWTE